MTYYPATQHRPWLREWPNDGWGGLGKTYTIIYKELAFYGIGYLWIAMESIGSKTNGKFEQEVKMEKREDMCTVVADTKVYWDEGYDRRIIPVMETLAAAMKCRVGYNPIIAASEHEGTLTLIIDKVGKEVPELVDEIPKIVAELCEAVHFDLWTTDMHISEIFPYRTHKDKFAPVKDAIKQYRELMSIRQENKDD